MSEAAPDDPDHRTRSCVDGHDDLLIPVLGGEHLFPQGASASFRHALYEVGWKNLWIVGPPTGKEDLYYLIAVGTGSSPKRRGHGHRLMSG
jgi:hypothetical protein